MGEHHAFGHARGATGGQDDRVPLLDRLPLPQPDLFTIRTHQSGGPEGAEEGFPGGLGEAGVDGCRRVTGVPDGSEGIDESGATREVDGDEFRHWPVA